MRCLIVEHITPPIPTRECDWRAYEEWQEDGTRFGYGATREAAIASLFDQFPEEDEKESN